MARYLITSESVTEGHPDKICDQTSDALLDALLEKDPFSRVACETMTTRGLIFVAGEVTTNEYVSIPDLVRGLLYEIGYTETEMGIDAQTCAIITSIQEQSGDIAMGVNIGGAGDQGMMFGYATDETKELMPMPISIAHKIVRRLAEIRKANIVDFLYPDGKSQVTVEYDNDRPVRVDTIVLSAQHHAEVKNEKLHTELKRLVINEVVPANLIDDKTKIFINPTGRFVIGGPQGDTGVTGRKIIVDTYGGMAHHGGGAFSGKDPSKVDRSAAYAARYVAKNIVAAGLADRCEIQVSYAIGVAEPTSISINTFGTGRLPEERLVEIIRGHFDLRPYGLVKMLNLIRPIYRKTAAYGHFGREEEEFSWESTDKVDALRDAGSL